MLAIKIILFCKYNKNWYRAWGKWHKIIFNKGKILIFFFFFFFVLNSWNASHENNFSFYENIMIKSMGKKIIQNYSLYSPHKVWSARYLVCKMSPFGPLQTGPWSTGLHGLVCRVYPTLDKVLFFQPKSTNMFLISPQEKHVVVLIRRASPRRF